MVGPLTEPAAQRPLSPGSIHVVSGDSHMITVASLKTADLARPLSRGHCLWFALLLAWTPVHADIAPSPRNVDTCTAEKQCPRGEVDICKASHSDRDSCARRHVNDGFRLACKTPGATVWTELWCRPASRKPAGAAAPAGADKSR